jgi:hypothetical protein
VDTRFSKKPLPDDFAQSILDLEIEIELSESVETQVITDLI